MSQDSPIDLALNLLKVLSHQVRNPLNIISNDLNYMKLKFPEENCDRSLQRCRQISDYFRIFEKFSDCSITQSDFNVFLKNIFEDKARLEVGCIICANFSRIKQSLEWVKINFNPQKVLQSDAAEYKFIINQQFGQTCSSFHELCILLGQTESVMPILADSVFKSSGFNFLAQSGFFKLYR